MALLLCYAFISYPPLFFLSTREDRRLLTPVFFSYHPASSQREFPSLSPHFSTFFHPVFLSFLLLFCSLFGFGLLEAQTGARTRTLLAFCLFLAPGRDGYALIHLRTPL
jgi:hypothetical protein